MLCGAEEKDTGLGLFLPHPQLLLFSVWPNLPVLISSDSWEHQVQCL